MKESNNWFEFAKEDLIVAGASLQANRQTGKWVGELVGCGLAGCGLAG